MLQKTVVIIGASSVGILALVMLMIPSGEKRHSGFVPARADQASSAAKGVLQDMSVIHERTEQESNSIKNGDAKIEQTEQTQLPPLESIKEDLAYFATDSLNGAMYLNEVLVDVAEIANLQINDHPDFDYEDDDAIAYAFLGVPDGMKAHMLIGLQPYENNGREYRYVQMNIDIAAGAPELLDGALRDGANINLSISYDTGIPGSPSRFALMLQRRVDLYASRQAGIDAYTGRYTSGAYYSHDLLDNSKSIFASTVGIVDGVPVTPRQFGGTGLVGDIRLEQELLEKLLARLQRNIAITRGE